MSTIKSRRSSARNRAVVFGVLSVALYAAVFSFSKQFLHFCAQGGFYNVFPVATVFLFSYVHGSFASNVWTAMGIEASHTAGKKAVKETGARPQTAVRKHAQIAG